MTLEFHGERSALDLVNRIVSERAPNKRKRPSKYKNIVTFIDGKRFASKAEAKRYVELTLLQKAGKISSLRCQVKYELRAASFCQEDGPVKCAVYTSDFDYIENGQVVTEDVKGIETAVFKMKAKIFKANYGRSIRVVKAK